MVWYRIWLFPKIRGPILVVPILRTIMYLGLFWAPYLWKPPYIHIESMAEYLDRRHSGPEVQEGLPKPMVCRIFMFRYRILYARARLAADVQRSLEACFPAASRFLACAAIWLLSSWDLRADAAAVHTLSTAVCSHEAVALPAASCMPPFDGSAPMRNTRSRLSATVLGVFFLLTLALRSVFQGTQTMFFPTPTGKHFRIMDDSPHLA